MQKFMFVEKNRISPHAKDFGVGVNDLPISPGVYIFKKNAAFLYIGKAVNIKERIKNHFQRPAFKDNIFIPEAKKIGFIATDSEIEALLLEAELIKKYQPKYNTQWKDSKNYFYAAITKETWPRVFITHQPDKVGNFQFSIFNFRTPKKSLAIARDSTEQANLPPHRCSPARLASKRAGEAGASKTINYIGPFVDGKALKQALKTLRRIFPFRTCQTLPKKQCLYYDLRLCAGPCREQIKNKVKSPASNASPACFAVRSTAGRRSDASRQNAKAKIKVSLRDYKKYNKNVKNLVAVLRGQKKSVVKNLRKEMLELSEKQEFEKANEIKNQIAALENVLQYSHILQGAKLLADKELSSFPELQKILGLKSSIKRIEAYDISNIQGKQATGSMVVFEKGMPNKNEYRKFKIKMENKPNDTAMLREVLDRRLKHPEWPMPQIILIDGGIGQLNAATKIVYRGTSPVNLKIIALAKRHNELFIEGKKKPVLLKNIPQEVANLILRLRDEAHRFAVSYHRKLRGKTAFN